MGAFTLPGLFALIKRHNCPSATWSRVQVHWWGLADGPSSVSPIVYPIERTALLLWEGEERHPGDRGDPYTWPPSSWITGLRHESRPAVECKLVFLLGHENTEGWTIMESQMFLEKTPPFPPPIVTCGRPTHARRSLAPSPHGAVDWMVIAQSNKLCLFVLLAPLRYSRKCSQEISTGRNNNLRFHAKEAEDRLPHANMQPDSRHTYRGYDLTTNLDN
ncbi:hypothetical protein J6590_076050 [Homalodisca vitripennis]|nr:hypothetical protein J6590_076050 [Homalodisca vitripennis]